MDDTQPYLELPEDFLVTGDYDSHRPLLYLATQLVPRGAIVELGCGHGSTMALSRMAFQQQRPFVSFETNPEWAERFDPWVVRKAKGYHSASLDFSKRFFKKSAIVFIDSAPGEGRKELIDIWRSRAQIIIVHDTEEGAEYVYRMREALSRFTYRVDLDIPGHPRTTAVSNSEHLEEWRGYRLNTHQIT